MFERFTPGARQVVVHAEQEAQALGSAQVDTDHFLLALLLEDDDATGRALREAGVEAGTVRERLTADLGKEPLPATVRLPFSPAAKKLIEQALRASVRLGVESSPVSRALLLRGLLDVDGSAGARLLQDLGVQLDAFAEVCDDLVIAVARGGADDR